MTSAGAMSQLQQRSPNGECPPSECDIEFVRGVLELTAIEALGEKFAIDGLSSGPRLNKSTDRVPTFWDPLVDDG